MKVAALQFDVRSDDPTANLETVLTGLAEAAAAGVRVVVLPEMWPTSFEAGDGAPDGSLAPEATEATDAALEGLARASRELDLVVCGTAYARPGTVGEEALPTNRLHVFDRGEAVLAYDKVHLFTPTAEHESFAPGAEAPATASTSAGRVAGVVCYDLRFPELCRMVFQDRAELLLVPAQWPVARAAHWRVLARARAVENQCCVVAANRTGTAVVGRRRMELDFPGNSLIADPHGEVLAEGCGDAGLVVADVDLDVARHLRVRVPVAKDRRPDLYRRWGAARD